MELSKTNLQTFKLSYEHTSLLNSVGGMNCVGTWLAWVRGCHRLNFGVGCLGCVGP